MDWHEYPRRRAADAEMVVALIQELAESAGEASPITTENVISYLSRRVAPSCWPKKRGK